MTINEFVQDKINAPSTESKFGYHFISAYMKDPWNFYLKNVVGIKKIEKKPALSLGSGIHLFAEVFYKFPDLSLREREEAWMTIYKHSFASTEVDEVLLHYMKNLWLDAYGTLDPIYEFVASEMPLVYRLPNGFEMTGAADRVYKIKNAIRRYVLVETKTTGWSLDKTYQNIREGDQIVLYAMALEQMGYPISYVYPEIVYAKKASNMSKPSGKANSPSTIDISDSAKERLTLNLIGMWGRLHQSLRLLEQGLPAAILFPRNPAATETFGDDYSGVNSLSPTMYQHNEKNVEYFKKIGFEMKDNSEKLKSFIEEWEKTPNYLFMNIERKD